MGGNTQKFIYFCVIILITCIWLGGNNKILHSRAETEECTKFGFRITPPYARIGPLAPGEEYVKDVKLLYSCAYIDHWVEIQIEPGDIETWLNITPRARFQLKKNESESLFQIVLSMPPDVPAGDYRGNILVMLSPPPDPAVAPDESVRNQESGRIGASISTIVGIRMIIDVNVTEPEPVDEGIVEEVINKESLASPTAENNDLFNSLKGRIIIKTEDAGEAFYIHPTLKTMHYLGRPDDAFRIMRELGIGITNHELNKIPIGFGDLFGEDSDGDGLPDKFEDAIQTDKNSYDTNNDGCSDAEELMGECLFVQKSVNKDVDAEFTINNVGKIFLQTENMGEAWYVNPGDYRRYFLGYPIDAYNVMRNLSLGISNEDFDILIRE